MELCTKPVGGGTRFSNAIMQVFTRELDSGRTTYVDISFVPSR